MVTLYEDTSWIGEPMKLMDIANGMIYVEFVGKESAYSTKRHKLPLHTFTEGWNYFTVPDGYTMQDFENQKLH